MPVQVHCPHCRSLCQVSEQYFGMSVRCGKCNQPFVVRAPAAPTAPQPAGVDAPDSPLAPRPSPLAPQPTPPAPSSSPAEESASWKDKVRGVFQSLMPFSKMEKTVTEEYVLSEAPGEADVPDAEVLESAINPTPLAAPTAPALSVYRLDLGAATSVGRVCTRNEDSFVVRQMSWSNLDRRREAALVVVADGMGGHGAGDRASHLVIQSVGVGLEAFVGSALSGQSPSQNQLAQAVLQAVKSANQTVFQQAQADASCQGMGATAAVVLALDNQAAIVHVGDCRVYCYRAGKLTQITRDQTLVERMIALGQLRPEEAMHHPARNRVAQAVGRKPEVEPDLNHWQLAAGDWLIVACDGLHAHVNAQLLEKTIATAAPSAAALAQQLVELADKAGGSDNCTVVAVRCF